MKTLRAIIRLLNTPVYAPDIVCPHCWGTNPAAACKLALLALLFLPCAAKAGEVIKLDLKSLPSAAAYQSFTSLQQVIGLEKPLVSLNTTGDYAHEILHFGINVSIRVDDRLKPFGTPLGGPTFHLPGSVLDWALGTKWGESWLPKLKTGLFAGYDIFHPNDIKLKPSFAGFGVSYPVFGGSN